jgi:hypothetical protein
VTEILLNVVFPAGVLMFGAASLGPRLALLMATLGPLVSLAIDRWRTGRTTPLSLLALVSIVLSGGIGLIELDTQWFAVKEAALPLAFAVATALSAWTSWPALGAILGTLLDDEKVSSALLHRGATGRWDARLRRDTLWFAATLGAAAVASGALAGWMVRGPSGSTQFAEQLGQYTAWSLGVVTVPSMAAALWVFRGSILALEELTGAEVDSLRR